jgi:hypothetical protein
MSKINSSIIRIVGLIGEVGQKEQKKFYSKLLKRGFVQDCFPLTGEGDHDTKTEQFFKDYFYPEFREIMFLTPSNSVNKRFVLNNSESVSLIYGKGVTAINYPINVIKSEIFIFEGNLGLFSLSIQPENPTYTIEDISNILSVIRNFDASVKDGSLWHQWISTHILCGTNLRGNKVKSDEYSGSKFKLFTVIDLDNDDHTRSDLIFDIATASPLGSSSGNTMFSPDPAYHEEIMKNRIGIFKNWEALCLFDTFTSIGKGHLANKFQYNTWDCTYFRIYLFRLFFKYNMYRYNSEIQQSNEDAVKWRNLFESFLNKYHVSHISFNFLANEIFKKTGESLELEYELMNFRERINSLSEEIKEAKQAKTNMLLQAVTVLSGISSVGPAIDIVKQLKVYLGWSSTLFYLILSVIVILLVFGVLYFIMPEKIKKIWKSMTSNMG